MELPKVIVGCPTYKGHAHCIERFIKALQQLEYKNFDVLFVDNSLTDEFAQKIGTYGYEVVRNPLAKEKIVNIVDNRNKIVARAVERNYDYLFFIDTDVLVPPDAIEKLLSVNQPIATGVYLGGLKVQNEVKIAPVLYDFSGNEEYIQLIPMNDVMADLVFEVAACGFGCCLIRRDVFEKVKIRFSEKSKAGEDVLFCYDARKNFNYHTFVNTVVRCTHMASDGDIEFPAGLAHFSFEYQQM